MNVELYTPETLAKRWGCSSRHVRNLISSGDLAAFKLGDKLVRIKAQAVEEFESRNDASQDCGEPSRSPSPSTVGAAAIHLAPMTRAKLTNLRQRYKPG